MKKADKRQKVQAKRIKELEKLTTEQAVLVAKLTGKVSELDQRLATCAQLLKSA